MAIGGVIGPGYFVGMGIGLSTAGPAGLLLCFVIVGTLLWAVMQCLGELGAFIPVSGGWALPLYRHFVKEYRIICPLHGTVYRSSDWFCFGMELLVPVGWHHHGRIQYMHPPPWALAHTNL